MQFTINKEIFVKGLAKIQPIIQARNTMPILAHVLLEVRNNILILTATDLEVGMQSSYPVEGISDGAISVSAKKLFEIVKEMPNEDIRFCTKDNDWAEITSGKARFNIVGLSADDFPLFQTGKGDFINLGSDLLSDMIAKTSFAICTDETKYNLNGAFVQVSAGKIQFIRMITTDGHRLAAVKKTITGAIPAALGKGVILPKKGVLELKKLAEEYPGSEIKLGFEDNSVVAYTSNTTLAMRLIDGQFPDYKTVLPVANDKKVAVDRGKLLSSLKRMVILSSEKAKGVMFEVQKGLIVMSACTPEMGDCTEDVEAGYEGDDLVINLNPKYLLEIASVIPDNSVELKFKDTTSPVIIKSATGDDFLAVLMPMRLNNATN